MNDRHRQAKTTSDSKSGFFALVFLATLALAALLGTGAPAASAAEPPCPNEAIREQQGSTHLPECRAWEQASLPGKFESVNLVSPPTADGARIEYQVAGSAPGSPTGGSTQFAAARMASGWSSTSILPPTSQLLGTNYFISAANPSLTSFVASAFDGLGAEVNSPNSSLVALDGNGGQALLHTFPTALSEGSGTGLVASQDLSHVYADVPGNFDPSLPEALPGAELVYDFGPGTPELVSRMPGTNLPPACGIPRGENGFATSVYVQSQHWTSTDGRRVLFATRGDNCSEPMQLYMRDRQTEETTLVSGPPVGGAPDLGIEKFLQATPGGSQVFFSTKTSYVEADGEVDGNNEDMDVYRWTAATGQLLCVTCGVPGADVLEGVAISEDGSHVYFSSANKLADAPTAADEEHPNTYLWQLGHPLIRFVARTSGVTPVAKTGGYVTPNGDVLLFSSDAAALNLITDGSNGGNTEYYRYDSRDGNVTCLSCPAGAAAATEVPFELALGNQTVMSSVRPASDDGDTVFFRTKEALVPRDVNQSTDIYEWHDGVVGLITNGTTVYPKSAGPVFVSTTPDGHDAFFLDPARLTFDARDDSKKLYDARVDGGFAAPPPPPAPCQEFACQPPPTSQPGPLAVGSDGVTGPGNVQESHRKPRKHHRHHHHRTAKRNRRASR